jgi:DtxR family Mn-dependent transcriptional regulator
MRTTRRVFLMPTATLEEYLETIYKLSQAGPVRPTQIAEAVGVSAPTVTATLKRLESHGLVSRQGTGVSLTEEGLVRSLDIVRRHRIAERFLVDVLRLDWEAAHEEACILEHALSPRVLEALEQFLGAPAVCPHGHPIPAADGSVIEHPGTSLADVPVGSSVTVLRVAEDEDVLGYLGELGLTPSTVVRIEGSEPFGGPLSIRIGDEVRPVAREVARLVTVE